MTRDTRRYHLVAWLILGPLALLVLGLGLREAAHRRALLATPAAGHAR